MPALGGPRSDPAPSRWSYRWQRLWLTPVFRRVLRTGVPLALVTGMAGAWLADPVNRDALRLAVSDIIVSIEQRPEFMVKMMVIEGGSPEVADDLREILPVDFPVSSFDLDLTHMRSVALGLDAVSDASLRIRAGGVLELKITERIPAVVWRSRHGLELLDPEGARVSALAARTDRADLPVIAGDGADAAVPEALALLAAAKPIETRLRGLVRIGQRRWDVVLDRGQRILLPEANPVTALQRVIALDQARDLLARNVAAVDMRSPRRPTVRMNEEAASDLRRVKGLPTGVQAE